MTFETTSSLKIYSRTSRIKAEVKMEVVGDRSFYLKQAWNAVKWADKTGRLSGSESLALRGLSGYQVTKLVLSLQGLTTDDCVKALKVALK